MKFTFDFKYSATLEVSISALIRRDEEDENGIMNRRRRNTSIDLSIGRSVDGFVDDFIILELDFIEPEASQNIF